MGGHSRTQPIAVAGLRNINMSDMDISYTSLLCGYNYRRRGMTANRRLLLRLRCERYHIVRRSIDGGADGPVVRMCNNTS
jgi:hypothetical protein